MATVIDLGQKVKAKYPGQYDDLSDAEVGLKVQQKFPGQYDDFTGVSKSPVKQTLAEGLADVVNAPGPLKSASTLFSGTGKFIGGALLNATNNLVANKNVLTPKTSKDVQAMNESNIQLDSIDQQAIQKARTLQASGETEKAKRLLSMVQSHGGNTNVTDILPDSQQNSLKQIAGAGAQTFLEQAAFAKGIGLPVGATQVVAPITRIASKVPGVSTLTRDAAAFAEKYPKTSTLIRGGAQGVPAGAGFGASNEMQNEDATFGDVVGGAAKGGALGFGLGAGTAAALMPAAGLYTIFRPSQKKLQQAVDDLEDTYIGIASDRQGLKNKLDKSRLKTEFKNAAGTEGRDPTRVLAEQGIVPKQNGAILDTFDQSEKLVKDTLDKYRTINRAALEEAGPKVGKISLKEIEERAVANARSPKNIDSGVADDLEKSVRDDFAALRRAYGDEVTLTKLDDIRSARWGTTKFDSTKPLKGQADYLIGSSAQKTIEEKATQAGLNDVAQLQREIGDRLEAAKFLKSLNGIKLKGGRIGKYALRTIGAIAGSKGGALGAVLGAFGGDVASNIIVNNSIASPLRRRLLAKIQAEDPVAYKKTLEWLAKNKATPELPKGLPQPPDRGRGNFDTREVFTPVTAEAPGVAAGRQNIQEKTFTPGKSGIIKNAPAPQPGFPVMRPGQRALPGTEANAAGMPITVFPYDQNNKTIVGRNLRSGMPFILPQKKPSIIEGKIVGDKVKKGLPMLKKKKT